MKSETNLARNISQTGAKSAYDAACKRLLANKIILAWIMKSCMEEYRDCDVSDIVEKYIEGVPQVGTVGVHPDETNQTINEWKLYKRDEERGRFADGRNGDL